MRRALATATVAVAALAGCYGSTDPATNVGPESATLNGHGTADNGPAQSWFQYWLTGSQSPHREATALLNWPAGASGPISQKATGLTAGAPYMFQLCGRDEGGPTRCAQGRNFTTKPAVSDSVRGGFYAGCCSRFNVDARSAANGANPTGSLDWYRSSSSSPDPPRIFNGVVTCLAANGSRAAVGAVGKWTQQGSPDSNATFLATIVDGRTEEDTYHEIETAGTAPPNCATASFDHQQTLIIPTYEFIVNGAAP